MVRWMIQPTKEERTMLDKHALLDNVAWAISQDSDERDKDALSAHQGEMLHNQGNWAEVGVPIDQATGPVTVTAGVAEGFCKTAGCVAGHQVMADSTLVFVVDQEVWEDNLKTAAESGQRFAYMEPNGVIERPEGVTGVIIPVGDDLLGRATSVEYAATASLGLNEEEATVLFSPNNSAERIAQITAGIGVAHRNPDLQALDTVTVPDYYDLTDFAIATQMWRWMETGQINDAFGYRVLTESGAMADG